jgi:nicotinamidase-related amidase
MEKFLLGRNDAVLVIVDIQERLASVMGERQKVTTNCLHLIEAAGLLKIPIVVTEQYPKGLGPTVEEIKGALPETVNTVEKLAFGCCDEKRFMDAVSGLGRKKIILTGMETHVCVLQTCLGLLKNGFGVHLIKDAVCSRKKDDFDTGIEMARDAGAVVSSTEIALFQLLEKAGTEEFKAISKRIK